MAESQAEKDRQALRTMIEQLEHWGSDRVGLNPYALAMGEVARDATRQLNESEDAHVRELNANRAQVTQMSRIEAIVEDINDRGMEFSGASLVAFYGLNGSYGISLSEETLWQTEEGEEVSIAHVLRALEAHTMRILAITRNVDEDRLCVCLGPATLPDPHDNQFRYRIPCEFTIMGWTEVNATDLNDAYDEAVEAPLPPQNEWQYLEGSFEINSERTAQFRTEHGWKEQRPYVKKADVEAGEDTGD